MKRFTKSKLFGSFVVVLLVVALPITVFLAQQRQDLRQRASEPNSSITTGNSADPACQVKEVKRVPRFLAWSPDHTHYFEVNPDANDIFQLYIGTDPNVQPTCVSCTQQPNGPLPNKHKYMTSWSPGGKWLFIGGEKGQHDNDWLPNWAKKGFIESGIWLEMYAVSADGTKWVKLPNDFAGGYVGPTFTRDGTKAVWTKIIDGNIFAYSFGKWRLMLADYSQVNGVPTFSNEKDITPANTNWIEPGNFSPDGKELMLSADIGFPDPAHVEGQDQYILNIETGAITNLTNTPQVWDEHGVFSPDGKKIFFMSSYPYRSDPNAYHVFSLKTEFMLMDKDGSNLQQLTHFNDPNFPEYEKSVAATGTWSADGSYIDSNTLLLPDYHWWRITFTGNCGNQTANPSPTEVPSVTPMPTGISPTNIPSQLPEDINHDGCVGVLDFNAWFQAVKGNPRIGTQPDINQDGSVDIVDFNVWFRAMKNLPPDKLC